MKLKYKLIIVMAILFISIGAVGNKSTPQTTSSINSASSNSSASTKQTSTTGEAKTLQPTPTTTQATTTSEVPATQATATTNTQTTMPAPVVKQTPTPETVSIVSVTSPITHGYTATLTAQTAANSDCSIVVYYKSGTSTAAGLDAHQADSSGSVSWSWKVGTRTTPGSWPISVTCTNSAGSDTKSTNFTVN